MHLECSNEAPFRQGLGGGGEICQDLPVVIRWMYESCVFFCSVNKFLMPVPKQHHSRLRQKRGRARFALKVKQTQECPKCGSPVLPHRACSVCGTYRGRVIVGKKAKTVTKKAAPKKTKTEGVAKSKTAKKKVVKKTAAK